MSKPFDASTSGLVAGHLGDWAAFAASRLGAASGPATPLDTNLSSTLQADSLFSVAGPMPFAVHLEFQASSRLGLPDRLLRYNVSAGWSSGLPVRSVLVLLRPQAAASDQSGVLERRGPDGSPYLTFRYGVVRVWRERFDSLLAAGLGLAPLAPLTDDAAADPQAAFARLRDAVLSSAPTPAAADEVLQYAYTLAGLRYDDDLVLAIYRGLSMNILDESATYQGMIRRSEERGRLWGRLEELRDVVLAMGEDRFAGPSPEIRDALGALTDLERLRRMARRVQSAADWDDLFATP